MERDVQDDLAYTAGIIEHYAKMVGAAAYAKRPHDAWAFLQCIREWSADALSDLPEAEPVVAEQVEREVPKPSKPTRRGRA